jgi:hypothetical protein
VTGRPRRRTILYIALGVLTLTVVAKVEAQRRGFNRGFSNVQIARAEDFDGRFHFCRVAFSGGGGFGSSWNVDFPRADINLSIRLSELTKTDVSRDASGDPNHLLIRLTDPEMFSCPFIMMTEVGGADFSPQESERLRDYLLKGGFLWADDFWGSAAWEWWAQQLEAVLPQAEYPIVDLQPSHPLFRAQFTVAHTPQIASINHWASTGNTSERGADSAEVHTRAILDRHGNVMVLITHNTDFGDSFEREADDPTYFLNFSVPGYAFGINALLYAMTH